jgi:ubiquitin-protein ligase
MKLPCRHILTSLTSICVLQILHLNFSPNGEICTTLLGMEAKWSPQTLVILTQQNPLMPNIYYDIKPNLF